MFDYLSEVLINTNSINFSYGSFLDIESVIVSKDMFSRLD